MKTRKGLALTIALAMIAALLVPAAIAPALAAEAAREQVRIGESIGYTGVDGAAPAYTFESSLLQTNETVGAMVFNISIDLPLEGDPSWNDWCGSALAVRSGGDTKYYDFGGGEVGWGVDIDGDGNADTGGKDSASWVGTAIGGVCTVAVPVNASDFSIDFYDNCWDSVEGPHYTINSAIALFGVVATSESVRFGGEGEVGFTGVDGADAAFEFDRSLFTVQGNIVAVALSISINLPLEGDPSWNDWCGAAAAVTAGGETKYYDFGGGEVGWGVDVDGDGNADTGGKDSASWAGTAINGAMSVVLPVDTKEEFAIALYDNCWDSVEGVHWTVNGAMALFGSVVEGSVPAAPEKKPVPDFDANGAYNAYIGIQSENWIFRNAWADDFFGADGRDWERFEGNHFNEMFHTDNGLQPGSFIDVEIKGNGTYRVEAIDFDFSGDEVFNQLFVSTNIPLAGHNITVTDVKVIMDNSTKHTFAGGYVYGIDNNDSKDYYEIFCINRWNSDLGGEDGLFGYTMPASNLAIEFTVSGFSYDKAEDSSAEASGDNAGNTGGLPADYMPENNPADDGGLPVWGIILIVVGAAAVIGGGIFFVLKRKG